MNIEELFDIRRELINLQHSTRDTLRIMESLELRLMEEISAQKVRESRRVVPFEGRGR